MTSEKLKPTPGPWTYLAGTSTCEKVLGADDKVVADGWWCRDVAEVDENSRLIAEAGTVHHECGLSPRELQEAVRTLQTAISDYLERQDDLDNREYHGVNAEPHDTLMRRRNGARDDLDSALAKHKEV